MENLTLFLLLFLLTAPLDAGESCSGDDARAFFARTSRNREKPPLLSAVESRYPSAAAKIAAALRAQGEDPADFHAEVFEEGAGSTLVFSLTHKDTYLPENRGKVGNPSGKDRKMVFDVQSASVLQTAFYQ